MNSNNYPTNRQKNDSAEESHKSSISQTLFVCLIRLTGGSFSKSGHLFQLDALG